MNTNTILKVQHSQLAQESIWLNVINIVMINRYITYFILYIYIYIYIHIHILIKALLKYIIACGSSVQSRVKIIAHYKAYALYQEEHSQGLPEATES